MMARIRNVGDLQYGGNRQRFTPNPEDGWHENLVRGVRLDPAIWDATRRDTSCVKFRLTFDEPIQRDQESINEIATYTDGQFTGGGDAQERHLTEQELILPGSLRHAIARFSSTLRCSWVAYEWGGGDLTIIVEDYHDPIRQPDRFLQATARKLSRWVLEPLPLHCKDGIIKVGDRVIVHDPRESHPKVHSRDTYMGRGTFLGQIDITGIPEIKISMDDGRILSGWDCWWIADKFLTPDLRALYDEWD